jgi:hypothetical protein
MRHVQRGQGLGAWRMVSQSERLPMMMPTAAALTP